MYVIFIYVAYICFSEIYILNITDKKIESPASYPAGLVGDGSAGSGVSKGFGFISGFYEGSGPDLVWRSGPNIPNSQDPICFDLAPDPNLENKLLSLISLLNVINKNKINYRKLN